MKLTRKRAIEKAVENGHWKTNSFTACAEYGVDYGIVLGLQMALAEMSLYDEKTYPYTPRTLRLMISRRLKKLEKG
jgi:hypothetical protein